MSGTAFERLRDALERHGSRIESDRGDRFKAQCPAHDDRKPSLSVTGIEGQVLLHCQADCDYQKVIAALGLTEADLYDSPRGTRDAYDDGRIVHRLPGKEFRQSGNTKGAQLFRLAKVRAAVAAGQPVYVVEGEKDVRALESVGVTATCSAMGASNAGKADWTPLAGADVRIIADNDDPGTRYARDVYAILTGLQARVSMFHAKTGKDAADHVAAGHGVDDFKPFKPPDDATAVRLTDCVLDRSALKTLPKPEPMIADTLDLGTVAILAGYRDTCKSFIAQDWAASVATGRLWQGRQTVQRKTLYIAAEGAHGLDQRFTAWESTYREFIDPDMLHALPVAVNLCNSVAELCHLVEDGGYGFVVIDTLAKSMYGFDENSAKDMGLAVHNMYRVREATGDGTVVVIHHTGKDKVTTRGSSALESGVDTVYKTEGDSRSLKLFRDKRKDGPKEDTVMLTLRPIPGTQSATLSRDLCPPGADITPKTRDLLSTFVSNFANTGASKSDLRKVSGMADGTFFRAVNSLVSEGLLVNTGTEKRPFYKQPPS